MGGKVADELSRLGIRTAADLRAWQPAQLTEGLGLAARLAQQLCDWGWGRDEAPVADKGPPKSLQVEAGGVWRQEGCGGRRGVWKRSARGGGISKGLVCCTEKAHADSVAELRCFVPMCVLLPPCALPGLQVQMTLTPLPLQMHPAQAGAQAIAGGRPGVLEPLPAASPDTLRRWGGGGGGRGGCPGGAPGGGASLRRCACCDIVTLT